MRCRPLLLAGLLIAGVLCAGPAAARDTIRIVGLSAVHAFSAAVGERYAASGKGPVPSLEATGNSAGMALFCAGTGAQHPDAVSASRSIRRTEYALCRKNGVSDIIEIKLGFEAIVFAGARAGPDFALTRRMIYLALARQIADLDGRVIANTPEHWSDLDRSLPPVPITMIGPPVGSTLRAAFGDLVMAAGAMTLPAVIELATQSPRIFDRVSRTIRDDGAWIDAGEGPEAMLAEIDARPGALGIFSFAVFQANAARLKPAAVDGVLPGAEAIATGRYHAARPLYIYVKKQHIGVIPGLDAFLDEVASDAALGRDGYLARRGLVPLSNEERTRVQAVAQARGTIDTPRRP